MSDALAPENIARIMRPIRMAETIIRHEIQYQRTTHQRDAEMRKELYRVNGLQLSDMIENLTILLCKEVDVSDAIVFP